MYIYILNLFGDNQISKDMLMKIIELDGKQYNRVKNFVDTMRNNKCPSKFISFVVDRVFKEPGPFEKYVKVEKKSWNDFLVESIKKENVSEVNQQLNDLYEMLNKNDECFKSVLKYYMGINGQARKLLINLTKVFQKQNKDECHITSVVQGFADIVIEIENGQTFQKIVGQKKVNYFDKDLTNLLEFVVSEDSLSAGDKNELIREVMKVKFLSSY